MVEYKNEQHTQFQAEFREHRAERRRLSAHFRQPAAVLFLASANMY